MLPIGGRAAVLSEGHKLKELPVTRAVLVADNLEHLVLALVVAARAVCASYPDLARVCHGLHLADVPAGVYCLLKIAHVVEGWRMAWKDGGWLGRMKDGMMADEKPEAVTMIVYGSEQRVEA